MKKYWPRFLKFDQNEKSTGSRSSTNPSTRTMKKKLELLKTSDNQKTLKAYREKNKKKTCITDRNKNKEESKLLAWNKARQKIVEQYLYSAARSKIKLSTEHFVSSKDIFEIRG